MSTTPEENTTDAAATTAVVTVPAEHAGPITRIVSALEKIGTWTEDEIEDGVKYFENLFEKKAAPAASGAVDAPAADAPAAETPAASETATGGTPPAA
jgi:DNA-binding protein H-NS